MINSAEHKFILLINDKMTTIVGILTFISMINTISERLKARNFITFRYFSGGSVVDFLFIVTPIVGVCNCSMFCCALLNVHSSIAIILMGKRELVALLNLSS